MCRSFLGVWKDESGKEVLDGRNNLGVVSINLPRIAIEAKGSTEAFNRILSERLLVAKKALDARIDRLRRVKAQVAPILYMEGAFGVRLKADDDIINVFKNGRSSISLGYIGLHEVGISLFGKPPTEDSSSKCFCLGVINTLDKAVKRWREESEEGWGYS